MRCILWLAFWAALCIPAKLVAAPNKSSVPPKSTPVKKVAITNKVLTVRECIDEALGRSPQLQSDRFLLKADSEAIKHARASLLPDLTAAAELQNLTGSVMVPFSGCRVSTPD